MRTDDNNNPTAFTTDLASEALQQGIDYEIGTPFASAGMQYYTAKLLGDPIEITIRLINKLSFRTKGNAQRWVYIMIPLFVWNLLSYDGKRDVIGFMYQQEGGSAMRALFPNYGKA